MNAGTMQELIKLSAFIPKWREKREAGLKLGITRSVTVLDKSGTNSGLIDGDVARDVAGKKGRIKCPPRIGQARSMRDNRCPDDSG
jgi:hypothetical protein